MPLVPSAPVLVPAGRAWCARFPGSSSLTDLCDAFRGPVVAFVAALRARGCSVSVAATRRPEQRAYLMRGAWDVSLGLPPPPARSDVPIRWTREGAAEMVALYALRVRPSLTSRHIEGRAVDMTITGPLSRAEVEELGASMGVHPLEGDPVHWSDDGH